MKKFWFFTVCCTAIVLCSCTNRSKEVSLPYEKYTLSNGLEVVLHQDASDPVVSVAILYHVGSNREKPGKTGFAHFFEHMLFQRSENLPRNAFFQKIDALGGSFNGGTWNDGTVYFETVPRDALEKVLWMESDRMGYFINTVTQGGLEREIDVVSNEKRQYENAPYGMADALVTKNLFPAGHPYSWTVIGEIPDLRGATVEDVKDFYREFYVPANATMVLAGDFDKVQAKELIEKYFGEIAGTPKPAPLKVQNISLDSVKSISYEDAFANAPMLTMSYPGVEAYNKDGYALDILTQLLAGDKKSPLYQVLVEEKKLAPAVSMNNEQRELAGLIQMDVTTFPDVNLNDVKAGVAEAFARFEAKGIDEKDMARFKTMNETKTYNNLATVNNKALTMAEGTVFGGSPDRIIRDVAAYNAVTAADVMRVYDAYIKDRNYLAVSIVPRGQLALALTDAVPAVVEQESLADQVIKSEAGAIVDDPYDRTPSRIDRSVEPGLLANTPVLKVPAIWSAELANGMKVKGVEYTELPLVDFSITLNDGMLADAPDKVGVATLTAAMLKEGTATRTAAELEEAIGQLGATITISTAAESMNLNGKCLKQNFPQVMALVEEILLHPRWDEKGFELQKGRLLDRIRQNETQPGEIAYNVFKGMLYGSDHILSKSPTGTVASVSSITLDDLKAFYEANIAPSNSTLIFVGGLNRAQVEKAASSLTKNWLPKTTNKVAITASNPKPAAKVYFVDYPGSSQSQILIGNQAMAQNSPEAYPAEIVNDRLGASSGSILFDVLRLQRGYTYGAYSRFVQGNHQNLFMATSSVQGIATKESLGLFRDILSGYAEQYTQEYLDVTRNSLLKRKNGSFEHPSALRMMVYDIVVFDMPEDYVTRQLATLKEMTLEKAKQTIEKNIDYDEMIVVVVGDAKTQLANVKSLNLGTLLVVDKNGNPVK